ncbi:alpha/beta family hydrolase [Actinocorallia sp. A-T 12471]|nr:alpha/beta family hydrolase [Actinocorallia sp. A-T 12471]MDX6739969.1 alpha/beta family hydrolase [Actinocorallia sp. A-T 12471]
METVAGTAEIALEGPEDARLLVLLTHGSNGTVDAPDLTAVREAALALDAAVARITQPFRLAGRRAPGSPAKQDAAWLEAVAEVRARVPSAPLVQCGRSNGARVACRTAAEAGAVGVLALAFPLHPPGKPEKSRAGELREAGVPVVVVNGDRDPFGVPDPVDAAEVVVLAGERHDLNRDPARVGAAVAPWLRRWRSR